MSEHVEDAELSKGKHPVSGKNLAELSRTAHTKQVIAVLERALSTFRSSQLGNPKDFRGWIFRREPRLIRCERVMTPDFAGWPSRDMKRWPRTDGEMIEPRWVCDIVCHQDSEAQRRARVQVYAAAGIDWVWLLDTDSFTVTVYYKANPRKPTRKWQIRMRARVEPFRPDLVDLRGLLDVPRTPPPGSPLADVC